ncbi:hypothetical protein THIOM_000973 [Candidatus Thiomargarita nelsonii]|uniref:Uncharacterized protein n=1 Tax=Candidatus Thiomargarita nelsonii TaxID=1003181 RepID=A0A176S5G7_9GAMM|nr:hypothetical protein THIOM_000973 [Candidatus Thiomargarita nelsonii]
MGGIIILSRVKGIIEATLGKSVGSWIVRILLARRLCMTCTRREGQRISSVLMIISSPKPK